MHLGARHRQVLRLCQWWQLHVRLMLLTEVALSVDEPAPVPLPVPAAAPVTAGEHLPCYALAVMAEAVEGTHPAAPGDVWSDDAVLHYLQQDAFASGSSHAQRRRVRKRARMYRWQSDKLYRVMADSSNRQVPPPAQRMQLVKDTHEHTGHFGEKRTMSLLCNGYWWRGMLEKKLCILCAALCAAYM
jgi:hypothetical protein